MSDIFEDMQALVGCTYISDLPLLPRSVIAHLPHLSLQKYSHLQLEDFAQYIFGTADISILTELQGSSGHWSNQQELCGEEPQQACVSPLKR